jgi:hypothetical protein
MDENGESSITAARRARAATHPLRRRILSELEARSVPLAVADFIELVQQPERMVLYHFCELARAGWIDLDQHDPQRARLCDDVRGELPAAFATAALQEGRL